MKRRRRAVLTGRAAKRKAAGRGDLGRQRSEPDAVLVLVSALVSALAGPKLHSTDLGLAACTIGAAVVRPWPNTAVPRTAASASIRAAQAGLATTSLVIRALRTVLVCAVRLHTVARNTIPLHTVPPVIFMAGPIGAAAITQWPIAAVLRTVASAIIRADTADRLITASPAIAAVHTVRQVTVRRITVMQAATTGDLIGAAVITRWPVTAVLRTVVSAIIRAHTADLLITASPAIMVVRTVRQVTVRQVTVRQVTVRQVTAMQAAITADTIGAAGTTDEGTTLAVGRNIVPACTKDRRRCRMVR